MSDNAKLGSELFPKFVEARELLERALDYELPTGAAADIKQALRRIERLSDVAALLVYQLEAAPGNRIPEATRAIRRKRSPFSESL